LWQRLMSVEVPGLLQQQYKRSRPMLWQRLDESLVHKLEVAVNDPQTQALLDDFVAGLPRLRRALSGLPVRILNPSQGRDNILVAADDSRQPVLIDWSRWSMEPIGAGWPVEGKMLDRLADTLKAARKECEDLRGVDVREAELAALTFAMEQSCLRQNLADALMLLPAVMERLDDAGQKEVVNE